MKVGDKVPEFILKDQHNKEFSIKTLKGRKVLLSFHPLAWTGVCTKQMKSLEENKKRFDALNTIAIGISVDAVPSKHAWAKDMEVKDTHLLSDFWPHGEVAKCFGIFRENGGFSERANIIIDEEQRVIFVRVYDIPQLPDIEEIINFLKGGKNEAHKKNKINQER
ncbi:MAG: redoxin domain-containing protein [bacterium]